MFTEKKVLEVIADLKALNKPGYEYGPMTETIEFLSTLVALGEFREKGHKMPWSEVRDKSGGI